MKVFSGLFALLMAAPFSSLAEGIPPRVQNELPNSYYCSDETSMGQRRGFLVSQANDVFRVKFENSLRPGELREYLEPLGIDDRIIANYYAWTVTPFSLPISTCEQKTFGSLFAEELICRASDVEFEITAFYKDSKGNNKQDKYKIKTSEILLKTQVRKGLEGTICFRPKNGMELALQLDLQVKFLGSDGKSVSVGSASAFHPYCTIDYGGGDGGGLRWHGGCGLSGLDDIYRVGVSDLIQLRTKRK